MNVNTEIIRIINSNLNEESNFEVIANLEDLTLSDIYSIEERLKITSKLTYQIVDNMYIRIEVDRN